MPNERADRLAEVVKSALEFSPEGRAAFLAQGCGSDAELRAEAEALLGQQEQIGQFLEEPALHFVADKLLSDENSLTGEVIDQYEIVSLIARGGMGEVYLARDCQLKRNVALKLIRRGMNSRDIARHFKREELLLASLNHPNIAQLYGGGVTSDGLPFFAMEYVEGRRLDEHCDERPLSITERLHLFCKVCAAVTYAHQHLVIHRDIKPSNIRVTAEGEPKLLDFGIAKLLQEEDSLPNETMLTFAGAMTPDYACPEQVRGEAIATTSDVYSLGVLLYRLLTGQSPYRTKTTRPSELAQAITDQDPDRPSTAIANNQKSEIRNQKFLKGDLDNIVLMAMRKEPARRYASVQQFSEDIRRHLASLPVIAHGDTWSYRSIKFIRRNRVVVGVSALLLLSLLGGVVTTAWQARATRQEKVRAESVNAFLEQTLNYSNPMLALSPDKTRATTMTEVLDEAARRLESDDLAEQPEVRADLERIIASSYIGQGKLNLADEHVHKYLALVSKLYGKDHPKTLAASGTRASFLFTEGKMMDAERLFREILPRMRAEQQRGAFKQKPWPTG